MCNFLVVSVKREWSVIVYVSETTEALCVSGISLVEEKIYIYIYNKTLLTQMFTHNYIGQ